MTVLLCPKCHKSIDVALELQGQTVACPLCNEQFTVGKKKSAVPVPPPPSPKSDGDPFGFLAGPTGSGCEKNLMKRPQCNRISDNHQKNGMKPWYLSWRVAPTAAAIAVLVAYLVLSDDNKNERAVLSKPTPEQTINHGREKSVRKVIGDREMPKPNDPEKEALEAPATIAPAVSTNPDPDLAEVRNLLEKNLPTGKWEEIQWWPKRLQKFKNADGSPGGRHLCRLKFRTANEIGGMEVMDLVFCVDDGQIRCLPEWSRYAAQMWRNEFPNDSY